jgi:hypothetical protein
VARPPEPPAAPGPRPHGDRTGPAFARCSPGGETWTGVGFDVELSDDRIDSDASGDHATATGEATLSTDGFPRWVAVRYDLFHGGYEDARAIAPYPDATPLETVDADSYEAVDFEKTRSGAERVPGGPTVHDVWIDPL